jgi:hypothetical protein
VPKNRQWCVGENRTHDLSLTKGLRARLTRLGRYFGLGDRINIRRWDSRDGAPDMRAAPNVGQIILCILTIKPLCNHRNSVRIISRHRTRGRSSHPMVATLRDVRKVTLRVVTMLPEAVSDGRTRSGRRWHYGEPLPIVRTRPHIGVIAAGLVAIVPDGPWPKLACGAVASSGWPTRRPRRD